MTRLGSTYIAVVMASLLVSSIAAAAMLASHRVATLERAEMDARGAQQNADNALEWALARINADANWRTALADKKELSAATPVGGSMSFRVVDADNNLRDDLFDTANLFAAGQLGLSTFAWQAQLEPNGSAPNCLNYSLATRGNLTLRQPAAWSVDKELMADGSILVTDAAAFLAADCVFGQTVTGNVVGLRIRRAVPLELPGAEALEPYLARATAIDVSRLALAGTERQLARVLLSAGSNPLGSETNASGIYSIDAGGARLRIRNCRIAGTLVVRNATEVVLSDALFWEAQRGNYPILLCDCPVRLACRRDDLSEAALLANFNPASTPYRGVSNSTTSDNYPSQLRGLIFSTGVLSVDSAADVEIFGCLFASSVQGSGKLAVHYRSIFAEAPPPGFRLGDRMAIVPGSVHRVAVP